MTSLHIVVTLLNVLYDTKLNAGWTAAVLKQRYFIAKDSALQVSPII